MNIAEQIQVDKYNNRRAVIRKAIDNILSLKGPARWRASIALYLNMNPYNEDTGMTARDEYDAAMLDADDMRKEQSNEFGLSAEGGLRLGLYAPDWFITQIETFDKMAFDAGNPKAKENLRALIKEFKELKIMEKV